MDKKLMEKCLLEDEEFADLQHKYLQRVGKATNIWGYFPLKGEERDELLKKEQLTKAYPIIKKAVEVAAYDKGLEDGQAEETRSVERAKKAVKEEIKKGLGAHWTEYDTTKAPDWVRAVISGTQEDIERLLGRPSGERQNEHKD